MTLNSSEKPVLEAGGIHALHFAPTGHRNQSDRFAIGMVVQLALRPGQGYQFIERAGIVVDAGQFVAHQLVEDRHRAITVRLLGCAGYKSPIQLLENWISEQHQEKLVA